MLPCSDSTAGNGSSSPSVGSIQIFGAPAFFAYTSVAHGALLLVTIYRMTRRGPVARIAWRVRGRDTMQIAGFLSSFCRENPVETLVVDDTGVGGGVVDRLKELRPGNARIYPFIAGKKAEAEDHFVNRITEVWWLMGLSYQASELDTDNDDALIGQVASRRYLRVSDGRMRLESKEKMHRSPDEADALAMTFAPARGGVKIWV